MDDYNITNSTDPDLYNGIMESKRIIDEAADRVYNKINDFMIKIFPDLKDKQ